MRSRSLLLFLFVCAFPAFAEPGMESPEHFEKQIRPLLKDYCLKCHSTEKQKGDLDLEQFKSLGEVYRQPKIWQQVAEQLANNEMPPKEKPQPSAEDRTRLMNWVGTALDEMAKARAGDPGPVVLRRLSNVEYTYTVQDLTEVELQPAKEFPVDGAAGEGFMNTGNALVMSPALLTKYLDAGKEIASHAVLLPDGFRFAPGATRRDWTDELLGRIKAFYGQFATAEGYLPLEKYIRALLENRTALDSNQLSFETVATQHGINARYLQSLRSILEAKESSPLLGGIRERWHHATPADAAAFAGEINQWQKALLKFRNVGHMKSWVEPVNPLSARQEIRFKIAPPTNAAEVTLYLVASDAGDGNAGDDVVWQQPRLIFPGRPTVLLRDVRTLVSQLAGRRERVFTSAAKCLEAAAEAGAATQTVDVATLAQRHGVEPDALSAWLDYLGIRSGTAVKIDTYFTAQIPSSSGYSFVQGWGSGETPLLVANSSDQHVRIPGNLKPHSVAVHPSPKLQAAVGWQSPVTAPLVISGHVTHAHPECGNGIEWALELRRGSTRQRLAYGTAAGAKEAAIGPIENLAIQKGDLVSVLIGPRDGNHSCDLTAVDFTLATHGDNSRTWDLARDVSGDVRAANPHADRFGNEGIWHFYTEPVAPGSENGPIIPAGSLLGRWQSEEKPGEKSHLAEAVQKLLISGPASTQNPPDLLLYRQLASLGGPLLGGARPAATPAEAIDRGGTSENNQWGLDSTRFGHHPKGATVDAASLCVQAPAVIEVRLPADLVAGCEFVTSGFLHPETGAEGSVQLQVRTTRPSGSPSLQTDLPVIVRDGSAARLRLEHAFDEFRQWFPQALCYSRIVPVDEVVTLALFHREDDALSRLMLDGQQKAKIDRLWDELHYVSRDALIAPDAFAQLMEYATQDSDPKLFEPFRKPIHERAAAFRQRLLDTEPQHVQALLEFAGRAYRRPLQPEETKELRDLYRHLREQELPHDEALRLTMARIFVAPSFLYRFERAAPGKESGRVTDWELANRLSYFLWSSMPDATLRDLAAAGKLHEPAVLQAQARRLLRDSRVRRLGTEFACQWLHLHDFDQLDEKSERHFPTFLGLRGAMYEEAILFLTDLFQNNASVLSILDADYTFLNEPLAKHYGISGITGPQWRRVDGIRQYGRGGILGLSATLAKQSGASRTSPILRGNWVSEVLLGDKLPKPPKDVPKLPEDETATAGLTVRQLVEKHSTDPHCFGCHARIDPFGYSLEGFDAIGRRRDKDLANRPIDTKVKVLGGAEFEGLDGLRNYLLEKRRDAFLRQFCRKLLGYALGRGIQLSDGPLLKEMREQLQKNDYRTMSAIETVLSSRQFLEIRGKEGVFDE